LGEPRCMAKSPQIPGEYPRRGFLIVRFHGRDATGLTTLGLQTISHPSGEVME
jgi:hypothetical protein